MQTLQNLIGGQWQESATDEHIELRNPATENVVAHCPTGSPDDVDRTVAAATSAQQQWATLPVSERVDYLRSWADTIAEHPGELAELECRDMGKPVALGRTFIDGAVQSLRTAAEQALTYPFTDTVSGPDGSETRIIRQPLGVTALILPWNFPVPMLLVTLGPLLAAGNTVVVKPSERSPLSATRVFELLPLPAGVLNLVLGDAAAGQPLAEHHNVQLVHFTGSVAAGRQVGASSGRQLRRSILELGGNDPVVIDADVDPAETAAAVASGAFINTGQICTSMERIYVHRDIFDEFVATLLEQAATYTLGDGHDERTVLGPLVDARQRDIVHNHVTDAVERGAALRAGGNLPDGVGYFYPPTVLTDVDDSMLVLSEETFGPVAAVTVVDSFEDGLQHAGRSRLGLAATVYTNNPEHITAATRIPAGIVWVNQWQGGGPEMLYEPAHDSGMGATGSRASYDAATRPVAMHVATAAEPR